MDISPDKSHLVVVDDGGETYEVTSDGLSNGPACYQTGMGMEDISALYYNAEYGHIWTLSSQRITSQCMM